MMKYAWTLAIAAVLVAAMPTASRALTPDETRQLSTLAAKRWTEKFPDTHIVEHKMMSGPQAPRASCNKERAVEDSTVGLTHVLWKRARGAPHETPVS